MHDEIIFLGHNFVQPRSGARTSRCILPWAGYTASIMHPEDVTPAGGCWARYDINANVDVEEEPDFSSEPSLSFQETLFQVIKKNGGCHECARSTTLDEGVYRKFV